MFDYRTVLKKVENGDSPEQKYTNISLKYRKGDSRIVTEQARYPLANIKEIFSKHNLQPNYQRKQIWDNARKSKLIESFIMNIPVPPIFLYEIEYSMYEVMDGQQRISTLLGFYNDEFSLEGLEIWPELNGKKYSELVEDIKVGVDRRYLSAIILLKESSKNSKEESEMKQQVFERLNSGGIKLEAQETRNALYPSSFNELLFELANNVKFIQLITDLIDEKGKNRMEDCEIILRFFAYLSAHYLKISKGTKNILDEYMIRAQKFSEENILELKKIFLDTIDFVYDKFGEDAFRQTRDSKATKMIYDAVMLSSNLVIFNKKQDKVITNLNEKKYNLILNEEETFNGKYTAMSNVSKRIELMYNLMTGE